MTHNERTPSSEIWAYDELPTIASRDLAKLINGALELTQDKLPTCATLTRRVKNDQTTLQVELGARAAAKIQNEVWGENSPVRRGQLSITRLNPVGQDLDRIWMASVVVDAADTTRRVTYYCGLSDPDTRVGPVPGWVRFEQLPVAATGVERKMIALTHAALDSALVEAVGIAEEAGDERILASLNDWLEYPKNQDYLKGHKDDLDIEDVHRIQSYLLTALELGGAQQDLI